MARMRDFSAWYHLVVKVTSSTLDIYINGVQADIDSSYNTNPNNSDWYFNSTVVHRLGRTAWGSEYFDGYLADVYWIDGQAKDATDFGAFDDNGVWQAAAYSGTFGTNGFHLFDFANESGIGNDSSGNDNDWLTVNNLSTTAGAGNDVLFDVPTNGDSSDDTGAGGEVSGNYCTWSPLAGTNVTLSNGNLDCSLSTGTTSKARATIAVTSGKYYWEITFKSGLDGMIGISDASLRGSQISYAAGALNYYVRYGSLWGDVGRSGGASSYGSALAANDVLGVALDMDNGNVRFIKNGSDTFGNANTSSLVGKTIMPHLGEAGGSTFVTEANFGQRAFAYSAPSGYKALCTTNLPTPTIADGSDYFDTKLWTGNSSTNTISGLEFSPDFVWIKSRSNAVHSALLDTVRGTNKYLYSSLTNAEVSGYTDILTAFNSDGFTLGADSSNQVNYTGYTYVAWTWDAGSSTVSNTDGSITASVRANQSAGFSIVSYTGTASAATIGHGLGVKPDMVIIKNRSTSGYDWKVIHEGLTGAMGTYMMQLNRKDAESAASASWFNSTSPTSTVFSVGTLSAVNGSGDDYIAYCFAPVAGYSAFGSYVGNGSTDGPFIHTGFSVRYLVIKRFEDSGYNWNCYDTARSPFNVANDPIRLNLSNYEEPDYSAGNIDILSNGFKIRGTWANINASAKGYIYFAFASNPFQANGGLAR